LSLLAVLALTACGQASSPNAKLGDRGGQQNAAQTPVLHGHPQVIEPVAGAAGASAAPAGPSSVSVDQGSMASGALAQPVSDSQIRAELKASGLAAHAGVATLTTNGLAIAPVDAPAVVQTIIAAGNQIARLPYRFGGGHGTFQDNAYDCSGSLSFAFAAAGLLNTTMTSGQLMSWGKAGPGKWVTVFAAQGHTFMYVAGLRFDTVALAQTGSRWSNRAANEPDLNRFVARHPAGL
jgi:cell wall-associated NlpC family hydrolase